MFYAIIEYHSDHSYSILVNNETGDDYLQYYLFVNRLFPYILANENYLVLHGCCLTSPEKQFTFCILGDSGVGKSTILHSLVNKGFNLMADDTIILKNSLKEFQVIKSSSLYEVCKSNKLMDINVTIDSYIHNIYNDKIVIKRSSEEKKTLNSRLNYIIFLESNDVFDINEMDSLSSYRKLIQNNIRTYSVNSVNIFKDVSLLSKTVKSVKVKYPKNLESLDYLLKYIGGLK